ncbi:MAG TPA: type II secretion system F family protein [Opitutales bacterium]|nr:type II secretion system F family protein [Opitutales bacterium]
MLTYVYTAVDSQGLSQSGKIHAACVQEATQGLERRGWVVTALERITTVSTDAPAGRSRFFGRLGKHPRPRVSQMAKLFESVGLLLEAGLPLKRVLKIAHRALVATNSCRASWAACCELLEDGVAFTDAITTSFPILEARWVAVLRAGEVRGELGHALAKIAHAIQTRERVQRKILLALMYPMLVLMATIGVIGLLLGAVVPRFESIFSQMAQGEGLPKLTEYIVALSRSSLIWGPWAMGVVLMLGFTLRYFKNTLLVSKIFYPMPLVGYLGYARNWAQWTDSMAGLLAAAVPIPEAMALSRQSLPLGLWQYTLAAVEAKVCGGHTLYDACNSTHAPKGFFPEELLGFIEIGEHSGSLAKRLEQSAKLYEAIAEQRLNTCMAILEPALIVVMAIGVGTVILSLFLPLAQLMERLAIG